MCIILVEGLYFNYGTRARSPFLGGGTRKVGHENLISLIAAAAVHSGTLFSRTPSTPCRIIAPPLMPKPIHCTRKQTNLVHLADEGVDVLLPVTQVAALDEVLELAGTEATVGVAELEWPEEVRCLLEVGSDSVNLVDQIFHTDDAGVRLAEMKQSIGCT